MKTSTFVLHSFIITGIYVSKPNQTIPSKNKKLKHSLNRNHSKQVKLPIIDNYFDKCGEKS